MGQRRRYLDRIGGALVALYRRPDDDSVLWFHFGSRQIALTDASSSKFSPTFADEEPALENASVDRRFQFYDGDTLVVDFSYRLDDREKRLYFSMDPFPAWPDEEENYDLLYFVHRILESGRWSRSSRLPDAAHLQDA